MIQTVAHIRSTRSGVDIAKREDSAPDADGILRETYTIRTWKEDSFGVLTSGPAAELTEDQLLTLVVQVERFIAAGDLEADLKALLESETQSDKGE